MSALTHHPPNNYRYVKELTANTYRVTDQVWVFIYLTEQWERGQVIGVCQEDGVVTVETERTKAKQWPAIKAYWASADIWPYQEPEAITAAAS